MNCGIVRVAVKYVRMVYKMYEDSVTVSMTEVAEIGLHGEWALSFFLFAMAMDRVKDKIRQETLWTMMLTNDIQICNRNREQEKVSRSRTECIHRNG